MGGPASLMEPGWSPNAPGAHPSASSHVKRVSRANSAPMTPVTPPVNRQPSYPSQAPYAPQQPQRSEPGRPAWQGTLRSSGGPKPWEIHEQESLVPTAGEANYSPAVAHGQPSPGGQTVTPHQPRVQSVHYAPGQAPEYRQNDPQANQDESARVVHTQYNSPLGLYSKQNVNEMLHSQTAGKPGQGTLQWVKYPLLTSTAVSVLSYLINT